MLLEKNENRKNIIVCQKTKNFSTNNEKIMHKENLGSQNVSKNVKLVKNEIIRELSPSKFLFVAETNKVKNGNLKNILSNELLKCSDNFRGDFLKNQKISEEIRARMVI